jgi:hypothetical protein
MCVLTFVPINDFGYILTNNRDENSVRPKAISPRKYKIGSSNIYFPKDAQAGGTWIAHNHKFTLCLLNGAFEKHISTKNYTKSRGFVILEFFTTQKSDYFSKESFLGVENFTLIFIENALKKICQIVWDGNELHIKHLDWFLPQIWSSSTLYGAEVRQKRAELFNAFVAKNQKPSYEQMINFHRFADLGDIENNLTMQRADGTITQSISQIYNSDSGIRFSYFDLLDEKEKSLIII